MTVFSAKLYEARHLLLRYSFYPFKTMTVVK